MKIVIHTPSQSVYPYISINTESNLIYLKDMGLYDMRVCKIIEMPALSFYLKLWYQEYIKRKKLYYLVANLFPWRIRKHLYKLI